MVYKYAYKYKCASRTRTLAPLGGVGVLGSLPARCMCGGGGGGPWDVRPTPRESKFVLLYPIVWVCVISWFYI